MAQIEQYYFPDDLYYDPKDHLWARVEGSRVRVGIDMFGQQVAGTVAYVKIMPVGRPARKGRAFGSLEAGKYIGPLKAPVRGMLIEVNDGVLKQPQLVNTDPYGDGWFVVIDPSHLEEDLNDLVHGEAALTEWITAEMKHYREEGLLKEDD